MSMQSPSGESPLPSPASAPNAPSAGQASAVETSGSPGSGGTHSAAPFSVPGVRITSVLGRGGFATVYAGVQDSLERPVAVKVDSRPLDDPRNERRFMREVQAASRISGHPHVVSLVDTGKLPDLRPYLVMELCSGGSLYDLVSRGPTPASDAVALVQAAASALGAAHAAGVTHRDVKPANILLDSYGSPRLSDFGIASVQREGQDPTVTLECLTPDFAAPEAFMLARPGPEGDVWSMGAVLFALLTGRGPRRGPDGVQRSLPEIVRSLDEPLNLNDPSVPDLLLPVLSKAMAPDPKDRFRNGAELTSALERLREQLGTGSLAVGGPVTSLQLVDAGLASPSGHRAVGSMGSNSLAGALSQPSADSARSAHSVRSAVSIDSNRLEHSGGAPMLLSSPDSFPLNSPASVETGASLRLSTRERRRIGLRVGAVGTIVGLVIGLGAGWVAGARLAPTAGTAGAGATAAASAPRDAIAWAVCADHWEALITGIPSCSARWATADALRIRLRPTGASSRVSTPTTSTSSEAAKALRGATAISGVPAYKIFMTLLLPEASGGTETAECTAHPGGAFGRSFTGDSGVFPGADSAHHPFTVISGEFVDE